MAKKKGNGAGTIFYDESRKKWRAQITLGYNIDGKAIRKSVSGSNKTEVRDKIKDLIANNSNLNIKSTSINFDDYIIAWAETYKKPELTENSYGALLRVINLHLIPTFGKYKLSEFNTDIVQLGYNRMFADRNKYSQAFARKIANVLSQVMKKAVQDNLIHKNHTIGATLPKVRPPRNVQAMSIEHQKKMVDFWSKNPDHNIFIFMLATGMRISEVVGMTLDALDMNKKEYHIQKIMIEISGNPSFQNYPKTDAGIRTIYLNTMAISCLKKQISKIEQDINFKNLVWPNRNYNFKGTANLRRMLKKTFIDAGVPNYPMHALRHTYATRMVEKGANIKYLQSSLGHKNIETTLQIYSDALSEFQRKQADEIDIFS